MALILKLIRIFDNYFMDTRKSILVRLKPGIPKRALLFVAGLVWTFAGGMLLYRGSRMMAVYSEYSWIKLLICMIAGVLFYYFLFDNISLRHTQRIQSLKADRPCTFSFFSWKSYGMMALMISVGVGLRASGLIPLNYLSMLYITMGIPLIISAIRFFWNGFIFKKNQ